MLRPRKETADVVSNLDRRLGVAAIELAVILPLLVLLFVLAVDLGRVFYHQYIVINAARCGALYGSTNPEHALDTAGIQQRVLAEGKDFDPLLLETTITPGTDSVGNPCIDVTVNHPFTMVTNYLVSKTMNVVCRIRMRVGPVIPDFN